MDNIEEKLRNLEEWNSERARVKPFIDIAVESHNRARTEARWKNYEQAAQFYREAIQNYKNAVSKNPKYYLQDLLERIDHVIEEYLNNSFNLKTSGDKLKIESGIRDFVNFIDNLKSDEKKYIDPYDIARVCLRIADSYYYEQKKPKRALEFYNRVVDTGCNRPFVERDAYLKMSRILFDEARFKEALVSCVAILSFDRGDKEAVDRLKHCLSRLGILQYESKFLRATPKEAKKIIMEVL
ncbi:tetratricopeptide repeat protein [Candidatus Omnitrophota bacterium]